MATFWMCHRVKIDDYIFKGISSVEIDSSVDSLSDTARIILPFMIQNVAFNLEQKFKRGQKVKIELGYNDEYQTEFEGYVRILSMNNPCVIECEDAMYLLRKEVPNKLFEKVSINTILQYVIDKTESKLSLKSSVSALKYDKFIIRNATGYEVLEKIKQAFGIAIYIKNNVLHASLKYTDKMGDVSLSMTENVKASNLQYVTETDIKVQVKVKGIGKDNKTTADIQVGNKGGEVITMPDQLNITDKASLEAKAKEELKKYSYEGYRGEITTWGRPFCKIGYACKVQDKTYSFRDGKYYVKSVKVRFSKSNGYERILSLGIKLS